MEPLAHLFKALAEPNRLRILNLLLEEPFCVCELEAFLGLSQSLLSRHLAYLRSAGLVVDKRQGMRVQYSLGSGQEGVEMMKGCLRQALRREEIYCEDLRRLEQMRTTCCPSERRAPSASPERIQA